MEMVGACSRSHHHALFAAFFVEIRNIKPNGLIDEPITFHSRYPHFCFKGFIYKSVEFAANCNLVRHRQRLEVGGVVDTVARTAPH